MEPKKHPKANLEKKTSFLFSNCTNTSPASGVIYFRAQKL